MVGPVERAGEGGEGVAESEDSVLGEVLECAELLGGGKGEEREEEDEEDEGHF